MCMRKRAYQYTQLAGLAWTGTTFPSTGKQIGTLQRIAQVLIHAVQQQDP